MSRRSRRRGSCALRDAEDEYRRLLYVAMTRAADRLIICGAEGERGRPDGCWYDLVREPLGPLLVEEGTTARTVLRYRKIRRPKRRAAAGRKSGRAKPERPALPAWLREPAPARTAASGAALAVIGLRRRDRPHRADAALPPPIGKRRWSAAGWCIG